MIIGAGASYDCASSQVAVKSSLWQPPLVTELFKAHNTFALRLHEYPLAEAAAAEIRPAIKDGAVAIEQYLRERLRDSTDTYAQRRYRQVPLYLQDLLYHVSQTDGTGFTIHPDNYDALVGATLALEEVVFLSLNYDTLLDERLFIYDPLQGLDSYVTPGRNWSLVKLHGSINWAWPVQQKLGATYPSADLARINQWLDGLHPLELENTIVLQNGELLHRRYDYERTLFYPALSVPLGAEDEIVCPPSMSSTRRSVCGPLKKLDTPCRRLQRTRPRSDPSARRSPG